MSHIGEALDREWRHIRGHLHHHRYDATKEGTMSDWLTAVRTEVARAAAWEEDEFRARLPTIAHLADTAEAVAASTAARAVLAAVLSPADEAIVVALVQRLDRAAHDAEQSMPAEPEPVPAP